MNPLLAALEAGVCQDNRLKVDLAEARREIDSLRQQNASLIAAQKICESRHLAGITRPKDEICTLHDVVEGLRGHTLYLRECGLSNPASVEELFPVDVELNADGDAYLASSTRQKETGQKRSYAHSKNCM